MRVGIFGAGGFGHELIAPLHASLNAQGEDADLVFIDDVVRPASLPVLRLDELGPGDRYVVAVGDGAVRERIAARAQAHGLSPFELRAPTMVSGVDVIAGPGGVFCDFVCLTARASIGAFFQANIYSYVAHDCVIGDYVTFAPKVACNGNVHIDDYAYIGTGAVIRQGTPDKSLRIGKRAVIGMGAVVTKDVPDDTTVVGNPARPR